MGLRVEMRIWKKAGQEDIAMSGRVEERRFITTVNNRKGSKRCHENLYKKLKGLLEANNCRG